MAEYLPSCLSNYLGLILDFSISVTTTPVQSISKSRQLSPKHILDPSTPLRVHYVHSVQAIIIFHLDSCNNLLLGVLASTPALLQSLTAPNVILLKTKIRMSLPT